MTRADRLPASRLTAPAWPATRLASLVVVLLGSVTTFTQTKPDRSHPPSLGPTPRLTMPPIEKRTLANGLPVWIVEQHEVPLAQVNLVIHAGSGDDPAERVRAGELHGGDARRGRGHALGAADRRRGRVPGRVARHDEQLRRLGRPAQRAGAPAAPGAGADGRRGAAAHLPGGGGGTAAPGAADGAAAGQGRRRRRWRRSRLRAWCSDPPTATAPRPPAPRRRSRR